ncbi:MAG: hypothetical protein ACXWV9_03100, partial [Flavisolibacter sp.]
MFLNPYKKQIFGKAVLFFFLATVSTVGLSQVYTNKEVGKKNKSLIDSLKKTEYPYTLPIWGKKAAALGYDLPYSAGIGVNTFWQKSDLIIENLLVGFNNGTMYDLDEIVRFNNAVSEATAVNIRPDIWLLPFLNVYAIFAASKPSTTVGFGIYVPDSSNNWKEILNYSTVARFTANTFGFGLTPTIGVGGGWIALDMNFTWSDVSALEKPVFTMVFGPRFGKSFKLKKPQQNVALWVGGFRVKLSSQTKGSIALSEVIDPSGGAGAKIDAGQQKITEAQTGVDTWWNSLTPAQQNSPVNIAKYETANRALTKAGNILNAAEGALDNIGSSTIQYSLDK